jgi:hypothetical protein
LIEKENAYLGSFFLDPEDIFNHLPENIKKFSNNKIKFKNELKKFLLLGSFYTTEEFCGWTSDRKLYASYL